MDVKKVRACPHRKGDHMKQLIMAMAALATIVVTEPSLAQVVQVIPGTSLAGQVRPGTKQPRILLVATVCALDYQQGRVDAYGEVFDYLDAHYPGWSGG